MALPLRGFYLDLGTKSIRLSHDRSIREKHAKVPQVFHGPGLQRNRDPEEQVGWNVVRASDEGETDGEVASGTGPAS